MSGISLKPVQLLWKGEEAGGAGGKGGGGRGGAAPLSAASPWPVWMYLYEQSCCCPQSADLLFCLLSKQATRQADMQLPLALSVVASVPAKKRANG